MKTLILIFTILFFSLPVCADIEVTCLPYDNTQHVEYNSTLTVKGILRLNQMLEGQDPKVVEQFAEISMVLVSFVPLMVQGGEINNPIACSVKEFTLHLSPEQLQVAKDAFANGKNVEVTGQVGAAESSIEEYDNAILRNVVLLKTF